MIIKSKTLSFSKIENEKEIVTEINNTDDEEKEEPENKHEDLSLSLF